MAGTDSGASPGPSGEPTHAAALRRVHQRTTRNLRFAIARHGARGARRLKPWPQLPWDVALVIGLTLIGLSAAVLDAPVGAYRGQWPEGLRRLAAATTDVGLGGWYIVPSALIVIVMMSIAWEGSSRRRLTILYSWFTTSLFVLCATGLSGLLATILKRIIGRARPDNFSEAGAFAFDMFARSSSYASFPSGHSTTVGAVATVLVLFFPRWRLLIVPLGILLASTRIVQGVHYPSDVIAGLLLGSTFTIATAIVFARLGYVFLIRASGLPAPRRSLRFF